jgi:hypothetical protein
MILKQKLKSMKIKKQLLLLFWFLSVTVIGYSQPPDVTIDGRGSRVVEPSFRITSPPGIIDSVKPSQVPSYPLLVYQQPTTIGLDKIKAAEIETSDKLKQLYPFYAKVGMGSGIMPLGQLVYNSTRSKGYHYGLTLDHVSSFATIKNRDGIVYAPANYDRTLGSVYGKIVDNTYTVRGQIDYVNNGFNYYGIQSDTIDKDDIRQRIQSIGGAFNYTSDFGLMEVMNYAVDLDYKYSFSKAPIEDSLSDWKVQEHNVNFKTKGWYNYKSETFYAIIGARHNRYQYGLEDELLDPTSLGRRTTNTIIDLKPGVLTQLMDDKFKIDVGFALALDIAEENKFYIYPQAEIKYSLFNDIFIPFAGIGGGLTQTTFGGLAEENQFMNTSVQLLNENNPYDIYGGVKGTLSKRMGFNINASFKKITNKAFFLTDTMGTYNNTFNVIYDSLNQTSIEASIFYQLDEKLKIDGLARFNSYELMNYAYAPNLPIMEFQLRGTYNLFDKFILNLNGRIETGRKAIVYDLEDNVIEEDGQYYLSLGPIVDFNFGAEYRYNKRITAFLQFNNMFSQRYYSWYNYPVQPIQVMGGVSFRF